MSKRLNVLFLSSWYPCRKDLFNGNFVERHAESVAIYTNVFVIYACSDGNAKTIETESYIKNGVDTRIIYFPQIKNRIPLLANWFKYFYLRKLYLEKIIELKKSIGRVDIIHANVIYPVGLIAIYLKKRFKIPYIITEHWTGYLTQNRSKLSFSVKKLSKYIVSNASAVLPVSDNLKKSMQALGFVAKYRIIPNVVNTELFSIKEAWQKPLRFIHISTLSDKHKNISGILRTVKRLTEKRTDFIFSIIGDGNIEPHIRYSKELNIPKGIITFKGATPIEGIAQAMRVNDVFVLFSNYENLPCVISEAHCSGMPVISTNVGGVCEMIDESNGILIPEKDENALLEKMNYILNNYSNYNTFDIRKKAIEKYAYNKVGQQIISVYQEVLKQ